MAADVRAVITIRELIGVVVVEVIEKQRREKMKKLAILSPLLLLATTALAQDSTCILQPSCSQLGYTSAEVDCGSAKVLRCPFDVSQVACVGGGTGAGGSGGGAGGDNYNPNDPNNELGDVIALKINVSEAGNATFTFGGGNIYVDCGEGTIVGGSASSSGTVSCSYTEIGDYTVKLSGDFTYFGGVGGKGAIKYIIKLDKSGITKMSKVCGSTTNGVVPPLPSTLVDATYMFYGCMSLTSPYPKLPEGLEIADNMFASADLNNSTDAFTGDVELPSSLRSARRMFFRNSALKAVIGLENTNLVDGTEMFKNVDLASLPNLPDTLEIADEMFADSGTGYIEGTISALPNNLKSANKMFYEQRKISGSVTMPSGLTACKDIFAGCWELTKSGTWTCN